ncbi:MAG: hypothetical protein ACKO9W_09235, partial [Bacteroidota bacterium]
MDAAILSIKGLLCAWGSSGTRIHNFLGGPVDGTGTAWGFSRRWRISSSRTHSSHRGSPIVDPA